MSKWFLTCQKPERWMLYCRFGPWAWLGGAGKPAVSGFWRDGILGRGWLKTYDIWHFDTWHFNDTLDFDTSWFIDLGYDWLWSILSKTTSLLKATVLGPAGVRIHTLTYLGQVRWQQHYVVSAMWWHGDTTVLWFIYHQMINHCHFIGCRIFGQSNLYRTLGSMIFPCMEDFQVFFLAPGITPWVVVGDPPCPRRRRIPSSSSGGDVFPELF